jgi:DNA-binding MarR family transcriptional regulator
LICYTTTGPGGGLVESARTTYRIDFMDIPDLSIVSLETPDGQMVEGEVVRFNVTVRNTGPLDVRSMDIVIYEVTFSLSRVEIVRNSTSLAAGEERTFSFDWTARPSAQSIRAEAVIISGADDVNPDDNTVSNPIYVIPKKQGPGGGDEGNDGDMVPTGAALVAMIGTGTLAGLFIFIINTDLFRYPFFIGIYPLYSKLRPETLLSNRLRKRIYVYVQNNPGEHFRSILVKLNLTNGTLAHHLSTLEKENLIRSEKDGLYRRFYPAGYHIEEESVKLSTIQLSILECIKKRPGLSQKEVSEMVEISNSTVNYNVKSLQEKGMIEVRRVGKATCLYPSVDPNS